MNFPILLENDIYSFPSLDGLDDDGLVAISRDVTADSVLKAYRKGIFPWFGELDPVLWWSPNPRCIIQPKKIVISKSMKSVLRNKQFRISLNQSFEKVIRACSEPRNEDPRTWLLPEMIETYTELHKAGWAHSVEVYLGKKLVGGFYGLAIGKYFAGESMFSTESNASKSALIVFCQFCEMHDIPFIDCQLPNPHLTSLGAEVLPRSKFLKQLKSVINAHAPREIWKAKALTYNETI